MSLAQTLGEQKVNPVAIVVSLPLMFTAYRILQRLSGGGKETAKPKSADVDTFDLKTRARVAQRGPYAVDVVAGQTYYWCSCGHSKNQPFCDGSHKQVNEEQKTSFKSLPYTATETGTKYFCGCKATKGAPFCDGSHSSLP
eukprot:NODE_6145_length_600_cov_13.907441_g5739_i0.p1 GENE.NODE_6145_length_600_cov_13.907441_g5739_i0~~NODE_6145_length_600_cov_13.907441_g5739_i0.p1  ORF type:complete len:141 (+),score=26.63 NODE_6145_length_600_cov_13.907441_g5739_i0:82-504(+)